MGDPKAFLTIRRQEAGYRPVYERITDYSEVEQTLNTHDRKLQASRCMDCGVPFRWVTNNLSGKTPSTKESGKKLMKYWLPRVTFRSLQGVSVRHFVRKVVY